MALGLLAAGFGTLREWMDNAGRSVRRLGHHRPSQVEIRRGRY
ncbi:MAG TPA: hypothetical protein VFA75_19240 [Nevskia sp.]|jgi:hypothetical protein|nr:hypothetical protein [Nevskia sp.]